MDIEKINQKFNLDQMWIYNSCLKPFIIKYLKSDINCKYKLFTAYFFQYSRFEQSFINNEFNEAFLTKNKKHVDLRYDYVKKYFVQSNLSYFIGYTSKNYPFFIHLNKDKRSYYYSGYMIDIQDKNDKYAYLVQDYKIFEKLQNFPIYNMNENEYDFNHKYGRSALFNLIDELLMQN